jgi:hypothetical protein
VKTAVQTATSIRNLRSAIGVFVTGLSIDRSKIKSPDRDNRDASAKHDVSTSRLTLIAV